MGVLWYQGRNYGNFVLSGSENCTACEYYSMLRNVMAEHFMCSAAHLSTWEVLRICGSERQSWVLGAPNI